MHIKSCSTYQQHLLRPHRQYTICQTHLRQSSLQHCLLSKGHKSVAFQNPPPPERIVFSGIQPTGIPHLGNYLGALREWVRLQDQSDEGTRLFFSVVDLHALTLPQKPSSLKTWRKQAFAALLAVGLDPRRSTIFFQSAVPAHTELNWILSTVASTGYLSRMTQWKSKLELPADADLENPDARSRLRLGLFSYPVLQAADILVHRATHVPVGDDQRQHLEFTRYTANSFNHMYGYTFPSPEALISPAKRIMSLKDPALKMSKSHIDEKSRILLTDSYEAIHKKIKAARTDSNPIITYDPIKRPGVSNLLEILSHLDGRPCSEIVTDHGFISLLALKEHVADRVSHHLAPIRETLIGLLEGPSDHLDTIAREGAEAARLNAEITMANTRRNLGL
ncbi:hypothetical protein ASPZODRAFT_149762 [Penicilliopsis zonata CBS 506.65]|uniref:Tryptophan--tRNA ligase, mitochondrial n=1 Tax=Penicilliopsis zonata CBS 506.65 TaxID=1073090 RepID=A0A1L9SNT5_9EURO|nr:hypothetical protein ASPZODRAFT_149762 [Penicilliopsis zonata CBS 506.65]OJJ48761.1 hypothetical protein ASPZODRAFT_149762 [Penicilliopsis zonata CBS 506.65]